MGIAVGIDNTVAEEVAVTRSILPEVSAVGPEASVTVLPQALVHPVPDVSALKVGIAVDLIPLQGEAAGRIAHGVGILRGHYGTVAAGAAYRPQPFGAGILRHVHVAVPLPLRPLVADGTVHAGELAVLDPEVGLVEVVAVAGLVAEGPDGDAGVVLVALVHVDGTVHVGGEPLGVVAEGSALAQVVVHAVRLDIGLIVDVQSVLVAELVETAALGIMGQTDGIDVVLLHQLQVTADQVLGDIVAGKGIVLVGIDALELDGLAVDVEEHVGTALGRELSGGLDLELSEAHVIGHGLHRLSVSIDGHGQPVQVRMLGRPGPDVRDTALEAHLRGTAGIQADLLSLRPYHSSVRSGQGPAQHGL